MLKSNFVNRLVFHHLQLVTLSGVLLASQIFPQKIQSIQMLQYEDTLKITYEIVGGREKDLYKIDIKISTDGGKNFLLIPKTPSGDLGYGISRGNNKNITWEPLKDSIEIVGDNIYLQIQGEVLGTSENLEFVSVEGGEFEMGDIFGEGPTDENYKHRVILNDFEISRFEITNNQFAAFLNKYKSDIVKDGEFEDEIMIIPCDGGVKFFQGEWKPDLGHEYLPVIGVTWFGANEFCRQNAYRLPTEAEWEYAAREMGKDVRFGNGKNFADPKEINFNGSLENNYPFINTGINRQETLNVGAFAPNNIGIFQMSGNVWEWCQDWYASNYYHRSDFENPTGPPFGVYKVIRGGSWYNSGFANRVSERSFFPPQYSNLDIGFRVIRLTNQ